MKKILLTILLVVALTLTSCAGFKDFFTSGDWADYTKVTLDGLIAGIRVACSMSLMDPAQCNAAETSYKLVSGLLNMYNEAKTAKERQAIKENINIAMDHLTATDEKARYLVNAQAQLNDIEIDAGEIDFE